MLRPIGAGARLLRDLEAVSGPSGLAQLKPEADHKNENGSHRDNLRAVRCPAGRGARSSASEQRYGRADRWASVAPGDKPNHLPWGYHCGETGDLQQVLEHLRGRSGLPVRAVVGISLGGNVLLKWLGEKGKQDLSQTAMAASARNTAGRACARSS